MQKKIIYLLLFSTLMIYLTGCTLFNKTEDISSNQNEQQHIDNNKTNTETTKNSSNTNLSNDDSNITNQDDIHVNSSESSNTINALDEESISWFYIPNDSHTTPNINPKLTYDLSTYDAIYNGKTNSQVIPNEDTSESTKTLYLTFDEGYENGYTTKILDILKEKNVKAVFFVTSPYIKSNPDLIKRMVAEGHVVGNHSKTHLSMPTLTSDAEKFNDEISDVESLYENLTGLKMTKIFRPPMGNYSEKSLSMTQDLGYKTVFWSFAYEDWDTEKQPEASYSKNKILNNLHDGSILLLHAVSKTNTEILGDVIDSARANGYEFQLIE